jgi:hypothetical protein
MARDWEQTFRNWSKPSSETEQEKAGNAESMIRGAIAESPKLAWRNIEVFAQGSYKNNTNVREDSDVDICVCCYDSFFSDFSLAGGFTRADVGLANASYLYSQFKNEVDEALVAKFGRRGVTRGNKAFDVHANNYRVDADAVPCFEHRRYTKRLWNGQYDYISGTEFMSDDGRQVINWPKQHYDNGVPKNHDTGNRFKFIVRALKRLRNEMEEEGVPEAKPIPSYLIECLVWNVPNAGFANPYYSADVRYVLAHTFNATRSGDGCQEWGEVNELKYLFRLPQPWTREQANAWLGAAWQYIGFP